MFLLFLSFDIYRNDESTMSSIGWSHNEYRTSEQTNLNKYYVSGDASWPTLELTFTITMVEHNLN